MKAKQHSRWQMADGTVRVGVFLAFVICYLLCASGAGAQTQFTVQSVVSDTGSAATTHFDSVKCPVSANVAVTVVNAGSGTVLVALNQDTTHVVAVAAGASYTFPWLRNIAYVRTKTESGSAVKRWVTIGF